MRRRRGRRTFFVARGGGFYCPSTSRCVDALSCVGGVSRSCEAAAWKAGLLVEPVLRTAAAVSFAALADGLE